MKNFNAVYGSPYSDSYYSEAGQSWDYTPKNQIRVANHWNFWSRDYSNPYSLEKQHAITNIPVKNNTHWTIARKNDNGVYEVLLSLPMRTPKTRNYKYDLLEQKQPNEVLYKFNLKVQAQKHREELEKKENSKLKSISRLSLIKKNDKLMIEQKISSNSHLSSFLNQLKNGITKLRPVFYTGNSRNTKTIDVSNELYKAIEKLNLKTVQGNDAPRGGKTGYYLEVLTKIK